MSNENNSYREGQGKKLSEAAEKLAREYKAAFDKIAEDAIREIDEERAEEARLKAIRENDNADPEYLNYLSEIAKQKLESPTPVKPMVRMKHISHLDLDGYGCVILSKFLQSLYPYGAMELEIVNILPARLMTELHQTLANIDNYDFVVVTDLAMNNEIIKVIMNSPHKDKIRVLDHHKSDLDVIPDNILITTKSPIYEGKLTCATELYYDYISKDKVFGLIKDDSIKDALSYFVECVRIYDTYEFWEHREKCDISTYYTNDLNAPLIADHEASKSTSVYWEARPKFEHTPEGIDDPEKKAYLDAPRLNTMFHIMERREFIQYIFDYLMGHIPRESLTISSEVCPWLSKVLGMEQLKNLKYTESACRRLVKIPIKYDIYKNGKIHKIDYLIGVVFAEKSSSTIANTALERIPDIDLCAVVSNNQIGVYTNRSHVDASAIAKLFGGGGHEKAAGFTIPYTNSAIFNAQHFTSMIECAGNVALGQIPFDSDKIQ